MRASTTENEDIDGMNSFQRGLKRIGDILGSAIGLVLLSPLFVVIYIMQKIEGEGPVLFRQERIGLGGKPFYIYKFRTMTVEAEKGGIPKLAEKKDERLTKVGRFLRGQASFRVDHWEIIADLGNAVHRKRIILPEHNEGVMVSQPCSSTT